MRQHRIPTIIAAAMLSAAALTVTTAPALAAPTTKTTQYACDGTIKEFAPDEGPMGTYSFPRDYVYALDGEQGRTWLPSHTTVTYLPHTIINYPGRDDLDIVELSNQRWIFFNALSEARNCGNRWIHS